MVYANISNSRTFQNLKYFGPMHFPSGIINLCICLGEHISITLVATYLHVEFLGHKVIWCTYFGELSLIYDPL